MDHVQNLAYSDFFAQLQSAQDMLATRLGICLVLVDAKGREMTLPSGLPLVCNEHHECPACHAQFIAQLGSDRDCFLGLCPNGLYLGAVETSIRTGDGPLYLLAGRTTDRSQTGDQLALLRSVYTLPFDTPFSGRRAPALAKGQAPAQATLTLQENRVLAYVVAGLPNKDIASQLCISQSTVKAHVASILKKLNLSNRTEASIYALRNGMQPGGENA